MAKPRRYVLDTHTCIFALCEPRKLGRRAKTALQKVETTNALAWIPAAVVAEIIVNFTVNVYIIVPQEQPYFSKYFIRSNINNFPIEKLTCIYPSRRAG